MISAKKLEMLRIDRNITAFIDQIAINSSNKYLFRG